MQETIFAFFFVVLGAVDAFYILSVALPPWQHSEDRLRAYRNHIDCSFLGLLAAATVVSSLRRKCRSHSRYRYVMPCFGSIPLGVYVATAWTIKAMFDTKFTSAALMVLSDQPPKHSLMVYQLYSYFSFVVWMFLAASIHYSAYYCNWRGLEVQRLVVYALTACSTILSVTALVCSQLSQLVWTLSYFAPVQPSFFWVGAAVLLLPEDDDDEVDGDNNAALKETLESKEIV